MTDIPITAAIDPLKCPLVQTLASALKTRTTIRMNSSKECPRRASVAIILRIEPSKTDATDSSSTDRSSTISYTHILKDPSSVQVLYIRRATRLQDRWSGHMAFPGGKNEPGETQLQAAQRETLEEVGLDLSSNDFIHMGDLDDREIHTPVTRRRLMIISSSVFLQLASTTPPMTLCSDEVAATYWIPIDVFRAANQYPRTSMPWMHINNDIIPTRSLMPSLAHYGISRNLQYLMRTLSGQCQYAGVQVPNSPKDALPVWGMTLWLTSDLVALASGVSPDSDSVLATKATGIYSMPDIHWCVWILTLARYPRRVFVDHMKPSTILDTHHAAAIAIALSAMWKFALAIQAIRYTPQMIRWIRSSL
ncbi:hypothetical protein BASA83_009310 [Batrachochytrium salamandrivorans]|nr:hypothetical protein BASA83_009310 [Batrachochytrium salamandrivorans]